MYPYLFYFLPYCITCILPGWTRCTLSRQFPVSISGAANVSINSLESLSNLTGTLYLLLMGFADALIAPTLLRYPFQSGTDGVRCSVFVLEGEKG